MCFQTKTKHCQPSVFESTFVKIKFRRRYALNLSSRPQTQDPIRKTITGFWFKSKNECQTFEKSKENIVFTVFVIETDLRPAVNRQPRFRRNTRTAWKIKIKINDCSFEHNEILLKNKKKSMIDFIIMNVFNFLNF